jgi:hypothetical protein
MKRAPVSLIANEGYEIGWTKVRQFFNQPPPGIVQPDGSVVAAPPLQVDPTNEWDWLSRGAAIYLPFNVSTSLPVLLTDNYRNLLIVQNNSTANVAGDVAANLFIGLDGPVTTQVLVFAGFTTLFPINGISLQPGESLLMDERILNNAIYVAWGNSINTGGSVALGGVIIYGRTPNSPPLLPHAGMDVQLGYHPISTGIAPATPGAFNIGAYDPRRRR